MGKADLARKVATAAAYGGGGVSVLGGSLWGLMLAEAQLARRTIGNAEGDPPNPSGWYGHGRPGPAIGVALLGDSSAAGYGVDAVEDTPGAHLASGIARTADRRVYLTSVAKVGAQTKDLHGQLDRVLPLEPQLAVVFIGANDVTHAVPIRTSLRELDTALRRCQAAGVTVVLATCPDLGTIEPLAPPLRQLARTWSRRLAAGQAATAVRHGARAVAVGSILASEFQRLSDLLFGPDRFHPSAAGYARMVSAVLPTALAALGLVPEEDVAPELRRGEAVLPLDLAAHEASRHPGSSVEPVEEAEGGTGPLGRLAVLRRRRRRPGGDVESPSPRPDDEEAAASAGEG